MTMNLVEKRDKIEKEYTTKREMWVQMGKAREQLEREMLMLRGKAALLDEIEAEEKRVYDEATEKLRAAGDVPPAAGEIAPLTPDQEALVA